MRKNQLIDSLDTLLSAPHGQARWAAAEEVAAQMGVKSILVAEANGSLKEINWLSTSMPDYWMEEYLNEDYVTDDPLVEGLAHRPGRMLLHCGQERREDAASHKAWAMSHGLKGVGYQTLHCSRFGVGSGLGKYVTLAFEDACPEQVQHDIQSKDLLAALLSSTISSEQAPKDKTYGAVHRSELSTRQREVLSLLAEGMMSARIAETLGISEAAVAQHFAKARKALGANTREHALALAMSRGLISL